MLTKVLGNHKEGIIAFFTTGTGATISTLEQVDVIISVIAGSIAILVGAITFYRIMKDIIKNKKL